SCVASLSIWASKAKQTCGAPNPRMAPHGGLFVYTHVPSSSAFGTSYGPAANVVALAMTAGEEDAYAPPSISSRARTLTSRPSRVAPWRIQIRAGWRSTCPEDHPSRPSDILTGSPGHQ